MQLVELEVPREAEFVSLARLVVASIADDRYELSDDQLDSLKLAISEACVLAIDASDEAESIPIRCNGLVDRLEVEVGGIVADGGDGPGLPLIGSLVDSIAVEQRAVGQALRMTLYCERAEEL